MCPTPSPVAFGVTLSLWERVRSAPHPHLLRIVMREAHDAGRQALLVAVELADLHLGADLGRGDIEPGERDVLLEDGRAGGARHHADLRAPDMHAIAVAD